jgi:hypothetical protein
MHTWARLTSRAWPDYVLTFALATVAAVLAHRLWRASLDVPFNYGGDSLQYLAYTKGIHDHGWLLVNPSLGAPFGLYLHDFPEGGTVSLMALPLLNALAGGWVQGFNLLYLLGYPLAALAALWALRRLRVSAPLAIALSVLYAVLPYHLDRGVHHYLLSLYYGLPPILSIAVTTAAGHAPLPLRSHGRRPWLRRAGPPVLAAVLVGLMSVYYVAFAGLLVLGAGAFGWLRSGRRRVLVSSVLLCGVIGLTAAVQLAPTLIYRAEHGTNTDVANRYVGEAENYPLKPLDLLLPVPGHVLPPLAAVRQRYEAFGSYSRPGHALGTVGAAGLLLALAGLVAAAAGRRRSWALSRVSGLGWLAGLSLALAVLGGGSTFVALTIGPYLRTWDRLTIAIAFFALAAVGLVATQLLRRLGPVRWRPTATVGLACLLLVGGVADQAGTARWVPHYQTIAQRWRADSDFVRAAESAVPAGSIVYQLPLIPWPERFRNEVRSNELLRPYLHSSSMRWGGGWMLGREPGWQVISNGSPATTIELLRAMGSAAVLVNLAAYPADSEIGLTRDRAVAELSAELGPAQLTSADGELQLYLIPASATGPALRSAVLDPVWMRWASGFDVLQLRDERIVHTARADARVELRNDRGAARDVVARFVLLPTDGPRSIAVHWPDGAVETLQLGEEALVHSRRLTLAGGRNELRFKVPGAPPRGFTFTLADLAIVDIELADLLPETGTAN